MFKVLLIIFVFFLLIFRVGGFFLRLLFGGMQQPKQPNNPYANRTQNPRPKDGNVHIDYVPGKEKKKKEDFRGGDYIDYEEVK